MGNSGSSSSSPLSSLLCGHPVVMISTTTCPYCKVAQKSFDQLGTQTKVVQLNREPHGQELVEEVKQKTGDKTVHGAQS